MQDIKLTTEIMELLRERVILMAMQVRWYDAERIAQYGRSRATLDATERRDQASVCPVFPQQMPWPSILA